MKTAAEVKSFLNTFEEDSFPNVRIGHVIFLTEIKRYSIPGIVEHILKCLCAIGIDVTRLKKSSLDTKLRRHVKTFSKKKGGNLQRETDQIQLRNFLEAPLDLNLASAPATSEPQSLDDLRNHSSTGPCATATAVQKHNTERDSTTGISVVRNHPMQRLRHACIRCQALRRSHMLTVQALNRKLRESRHSLAATKTQYSVKATNLYKKRKQQQLTRLTGTVTEQRAKLSTLERELTKTKARCESLASDLRVLKGRLADLERQQAKWTGNVRTIRDLEKEVKDLRFALDVAEDIAEEKAKPSETVGITTKTKRYYDTSLRKVVYRCLSRQVPVESVGHVIEYSVSTLTGQTVSHVPSASTVAQMTREMGILSDLQVAEKLLVSSSVNLAWDATTLDGKHLNQIHFNFPTETLTLNTQQLPGGRANDYADHILSSIQDLAHIHALFSGCSKDELLTLIHGKILSTLSDRAAVNHATVELLQEKLNISLLEFNCQIHPLDGLANAARSILKEEDKAQGMASKVFGSDCQAANVLHLISKLRYKAKGDPGGFKAFLKSKGKKCGVFVRYVGNRLHVLFHLAGIVFRHKDLLLEFVEGLCAAKKMSAALRADLKQPHITTHLQALGLMGKLLTGPWMALFYTGMKERNHLEMTAYLKAAIEGLKQLMEEPVEALCMEKDLFGKVILSDDTLKALQQHDAHADSLCRIISKLAAGFLQVLQRQLVRYIEGPLAEPTPDIIRRAEAAPVHNIWAERALGMTDAQCRRAPNATQGFIDSKVKVKVNATLEWLDRMTPQQQDAIVKFAGEQAIDGRRRERQRLEEMETEMLRRMKEREQKKEMTDRNRLERQVRAAIASGAPVSSNLPIQVDIVKAETAEKMTEEKWLVGKRLLHLWNVDGQVVEYHGRVLKEARKSRDLTVAYWGLNEEEEDAEDHKLKLSVVITDFLLGDLQFQ